MAELETHGKRARRAREHVRMFVRIHPDPAALAEVLPVEGWPIDDVPEHLATFIETFRMPESPAGVSAVLEENSWLFENDHRQALKLAAFLRPDDRLTYGLSRFVENVAERGIVAVMEEYEQLTRQFAVVNRWVACKSWEESLEFANSQPGLLEDDDTLKFFAANTELPNRMMYIAIVLLSQSLPVADIYHFITNPADAAEYAISQLAEGNSEVGYRIIDLSPACLNVPFWGTVLMATITALGEGRAEQEFIVALMKACARTGTTAELVDASMSLRRMAEKYQEEGRLLQEMAAILH